MNLAKDAYKGQQAFQRMRKSFVTTDGYQNIAAKLGINQDNLSSGGSYGFGGFITRQRLLLEAAYRTSWIIGQVVDVVAEDMTREGIEINCDLDPQDIDAMQRKLTQTGIWTNITNAIKWGRLYGGAVAIMLIKGQEHHLDKPLDIDTVGKDSFKGLLVLDRWLLNPTLGILDPEYGPNYGMPMYYEIIEPNLVIKMQRVHYSRLIRFEGIELPFIWKQAENLWSESVCERMWDRLLAFDSVTQGAAQLIYKAHLRTVGVDGLRQILAAGGPAEAALVKMFQHIRRMQSNEGLTILDAKDTFDVSQYTFAGLAEMIIQFGQQISGATGIPLVRLFGQSPTGMNATGESDIRNYYDNIATIQESALKESLLTIIRVLARSMSLDFKENGTITFNALWQMSDKEKAEIAQLDGATVNNLFNSGIITRACALKELKQQSRITGRFTNIIPEEIAEAEKEPLRVIGEIGSSLQDDPDHKDQ